MLVVSIQIKGDKEVQRKMKRLGASLYMFGEAMAKIGKEAGAYYSNQGLNSQGGVYGNVWPRLAPSTLRSKARTHRNHLNDPLVASGMMRDGFVSSSNNTSVIISNKMPYYKYHQSTAPRKSHLPRRQMAGINDPIKRMVGDLLRADIEKKIRNA